MAHFSHPGQIQPLTRVNGCNRLPGCGKEIQDFQGSRLGLPGVSFERIEPFSRFEAELEVKSTTAGCGKRFQPLALLRRWECSTGARRHGSRHHETRLLREI